ncbi:myo-inositol-1(or 4)-monophosphatase [Chitinophaga sp. YR627]|uniref:inositol monophosphatase family protein n=1 Tax=Chitinophaga sp. YR627 TaxID=1881041 RepID=UPI0008EDDD72|nr:inositol monophosphatase family protein [Chitinophaga sp. YR627]SFO60086.1 myo-inositol-1(or 4)-monophosphatase [Chitinophaga sp. YR627]
MNTLLIQSSEVIKKAGNSIKKEVPSVKAWNKQEMLLQFKKVNTLCTNIIREGLLAIAPDIPWSEAEFDPHQQKDPALGDRYWVSDPLDGAIHFLQGFSPWCISLALIENGLAVFSVIYDAVRDELFTALRGQGAWMNGEKLSVNIRNRLSDAILVTAHPNQPDKAEKEVRQLLYTLETLLPRAGAVRMMGPSSLQLAYVAAGRIDAFWELGDDAYDWLAGALMVEEAGGVVRTMEGFPYSLQTDTGILAGNETMADLVGGEIARILFSDSRIMA